jgi:Predicted membrane protein (DUF2207) N-terminal domain
MVRRIAAPLRWLLCLAGVLALAGAAAAQSADEGGNGGRAPSLSEERILDYSTRIEVGADDGIVVTDRIRVVAAGLQIRHGIFRQLPLRQRVPNGGSRTVTVRVLEIRRDGAPEPYHIERRNDEVRIYIGRKDAFVRRGVHTYAITYRVRPWVVSYLGKNSLVWVPTGARWPFTIERASATIVLPRGTSLLTSFAKTGRPDQHGAEFTKRALGPGTIAFRTNRPLRPGEGLYVGALFVKRILGRRN